MSLKDFQTILVPSNKNGALQFYHKPTKVILESAFSRPNVGATSGATVFRDGQLIELGENDPDWDDANGCPRIIMRPQAQNLCNAADTILAASKVNTVIPNATSLRENGSVASEFFAFQDFAGFSELTEYTIQIELEPVGDRNFRFQEGLGSGATSNINFTAETASGGTLTKLNNGRFVASVQLTTGAGQTTIRILMRLLGPSMEVVYDGDVNKGVNIYLRDIQEGHDKKWLVPGSLLARSANSINWNNMQASGVLGSDAGAWLIKLKDYQSWANVSTFLRLDGDGSDTLRLSARTNNQLLLLFDAGLGTNSLGTAFNGADSVISVTYDTTWLRLFVGASKHAEIEHGGSLSLDNLRTNIASAFAEIALMAFTPVFLSDSQMIDANTETQNL